MFHLCRMQYFGYIVLRLFVGLLWITPFPVLYLISDGLAALFYHVIGYRKKVVIGQLEKCFPEKTPEEIRKIAKNSYRNLTDILLETIKGISMPVEELHRRYQYLNREALNQHFRQGQCVVMCGSHFNNWEWGVVTAARGLEGNAIGVYKPLTNKYIDRYFNKSRERDGLILKSMKETFGAVEAYKNNPTVFIIVADQSPSNRNTAQWTSFFGHRTAVGQGTDIIARQNNYPVYHFEITRVKRGHYTIDYQPICLDPTQTQTSEISQLFMSKLEAMIRRQPECWLWSHKRWKF